MCASHQFPLYKWDGSQFNLEHNFTSTEDHDFWGVKMCSDGTIITTIEYPVDGEKRSAFRLYSSNYELVQELFTEEIKILYTLITADDC